ncbi:Retrovirus-related Pol polyprotein from transposon TNT 1-94 [Araneus ventricosus]|uniref:Retrovirus-related Pol polyprotein from transposon TNT 1-94 n=1 Tax=Araneus ventricosus TaxID=182803 RepID=A0A4Y2NIZ6_ARAVE|nr:Retrovirus-related Pol polyprotein from transposon TNT 1-94 [Araneus ventricosus]
MVRSHAGRTANHERQKSLGITRIDRYIQSFGMLLRFFSIKRDDKNKIKRFKARLVAQGFKQRKGEYFDEVYSPVVNFGIIRFFFAILVCLNKWLHLQCDVKCAYLYAPLKEQIFMKQPPGFEQNPNLVCRLQKALYGLHQSGRAWYFEIHRILGELGFKKFNWCNCAYVFNKYVVLLLYVDEIILFGKTQSWIYKAVNLLKRKFDLKILGKTKRLLGVEFLEDNRNLYIHQSEYISELCKSYEKYKFPVSSLPISKGVIFSKTQCPQNNSELEEMSKIPYRSLVGSLSFLAGRTRFDITYAINIFSQFQENPGITHWNGLLKLLGYIRYTKDLKLNLSNTQDLNLTAYSDADFANNRDDCISMNGQIVFIDQVPVTWRSFKQKSSCLSSKESEFVELTETAKELIWL